MNFLGLGVGGKNLQTGAFLNTPNPGLHIPLSASSGMALAPGENRHEACAFILPHPNGPRVDYISHGHGDPGDLSMWHM